VTYGGTKVLCTAVAQKQARDDIDFFPLTVNYQEKAFAAGKIPGGYFKREARPGEKETLTSRLIDRPIRPMFHPNFKNETQVICTVLSYDKENDPDVVAMVGASAALTISGIPFFGPIGGARVGFVDGKYVVNPTPELLEKSQLDLVVAGTKTSVLMVESEAHELSEEQMLGAVMHGHEAMQPVMDMIVSLAEACAKEPWDVPEVDHSALEKTIRDMAEKDIRAAYEIKQKQERSNKISEIKERVLLDLKEKDDELNEMVTNGLLKKVEKDVVRGNILKTSKRIDDRDTNGVRPIESQVDLLPLTHGSALFTRGETQALVVATLGTGDDEQMIDSIEGDNREHFMLHYNFPPYSVGEASFLRAPGRREIGHGRLAKRALLAVMPNKDEFPYTVRLVSEVTESNGSSSMATVCGSSLALMSSGVPIKRGVSGIAMGLIKEGEKFAVLSDILGDEDHLGDMDFKVAGTREGVTALQMDIKIDGITEEIMKVALHLANEGRLHILDEMEKTIKDARADLNASAPKLTTIEIPKDKIREVIGSGGSVIRELCETTGAKIDIEQDGTVTVAAADGHAAQEAIDRIKAIVAEPEVGEIYEGVVDDVVDFGAFVKILGNSSGLVHISELAFDRVEKVTDVINPGETIYVKCIGLDRGKVRLSYRMVDQETGEEATPPEGWEPPAPRPANRDKRDEKKRAAGGGRRRPY